MLELIVLFQETVEVDPMPPIKEDVVKVVQIIPQDALKHRTKEQMMDVPVHQSQENSFEVITAVLGERDFEHISDDTFLGEVPQESVSE